jgi:UDP-glucose 4-epimerase
MSPTDRQLAGAVTAQTVAVLGASGPLGRALLTHLDADTGVGRILGLDGAEPEMPVAKLEFRRADVRDRLLPRALAGADTVVHLAVTPSPLRDQDTMFAVNVQGTRNVLEAAARVGARKLVYLSHGIVYGANPGNDLPLDESAPRRANPEFSLAWQRLLAEDLVTEWAHAHPDVTVTVLRPATILGHGHMDFVTRFLEMPRLPFVRGRRPPLQVVHLEDVASAAALAVLRELPGAFNVSADGWVSIRELSHLLGRGIVELPEEVALILAQRLWRLGLSPAPPGALSYLMEPWVLSNESLRAHGWVPAHSNRDTLREFAAEHRGYYALGRVRLRRRTAVLATMLPAGLLPGVLLGRRLLRQRRPAVTAQD